MEQLIMSPASTSEIIVAKIVPLFALLCVMMVIALGVLKFVFHIPFHGSCPTSCLEACCAFCLGSVSVQLSPLSVIAQQAQLTAFSSIPPWFLCQEP